MPEHQHDVDAAAGPREIELKLEGDPAAIAAALRSPVIAAAGKPRRLLMKSTYFDTPDCRLGRAGATLRVRKEGRRYVQTVKSAARLRAGFVDRREEAVPVKDGRPDLAAAAAGGLAALLADPAVADQIRPAFTVTTRRSLVRVAGRHGIVEVAFDLGTVDAGGRSLPIAEVELELKSGAPAALFELALVLADAAPLRLATRPKSARGYALLGLAGPPPQDHQLQRRMPAAKALTVIGRRCLTELGAAEGEFRRSQGPTELHQMRVALRRLRAALTLFARVAEDESRAAIDAELAWMAGALGAARDLDVTIASIADPAVARHPGEGEFAALRAALVARRDAAYVAAAAAVGSARFRRGVIAAAAWIEAGPWRQTPGHAAARRRHRPVAAHAAREMRRRWRALKKGAGRLAAMSLEERHRLRIRTKKLRYAAEFFAPLFRGRGARKRLHSAQQLLEALQDRLGELHDLDVLDARPGNAATLERLRIEEADRAAGLLDQAVATARGLARIKPFWD